MRRRHYLKRNKATQRPTRHLFVDIESRLIPNGDDTTTHRLWFGWCCFWRRRAKRGKDTFEWFRFDDVGTFWTYVDSHTHKREPLYLIAHNVGYDFGVMDIFENMERLGYTLSSFYTSGMTTICELVKEGTKVVVLDNGNYFGGALEKWGQAIGFPKGDVNPLTDSIEKVDPYCHRDTEIMLKLWKGLYDFLDVHDLGNWGKTLPSQAFSAYRHRFMQHRIVIHGNPDALKLEREAYHGGRTSVFYKGTLNEGPYYKLDVNSMYPAMMKAQRYPNDLLGIKEPMGMGELIDKVDKYAVIAHVRVHTEEPCYSVNFKGHAVYPVGTFETTLCTPELKYALEHNHIMHVMRAAHYSTEPLFDEYVEFFYGLKQSYAEQPGNPYYAFTKLYLNSLYGKFGQLAHSWKRLEGDAELYADTDLYINVKTGQKGKVYRFGSSIWTCEVKGESFNSFPAIAAHVTAYARMELWRIRELIGPSHFLYTDTDSIMTDSIGLEAMQETLHDTRLGAWKSEGETDKVVLLAPKVYTFGMDTKRKGVPKKAKYLGDDTWEFQRFASLKGQSSWQRGTAYHTTTATRHLTYKIYDGHETESGWIRPLDASELWPEAKLNEEQHNELDRLSAKKQQLAICTQLNSRDVYRLWDYRRKVFRFGGDVRHTVLSEQSALLSNIMQDCGITRIGELREAITNYLTIRSQIQKINQRIYRIHDNAGRVRSRLQDFGTRPRNSD